jgi:two-component system cell cycle response regulator
MPARILIVEDDLSSREQMAGLLRSAGHAVTSAGDGASGLRLAFANRPDLIVCALALPAMDGYGLARALKADTACARIPLLAVSARAVDGFDGYIGNPIEAASFVAEVEAFLPIAATTPAAPSTPTLLVVDDDAFMRDVLVDALEGEPWRILSAGSAEEALALLAREPADVILSDQSMPGMQGTELMAQVSRTHPRTVRLILSGLSGPSELEAIERACAAGQVDRHLVKPWTAGALREDLRAAFLLRGERH